MTIFDTMATCFFHPVKVVFLDDNRAFLDALELEFSAQINMLTFTSPNEALRALDNSGQNITSSTFKLINNVNADTTTDRVFGFEINKLLNIIYDISRFNHAPVLVVDYEMPDINGIEFCQKLKNRDIFKIMLTAEADKDTAIKAFNKGVIDKFILKTSENLSQDLMLAVSELTQRYFEEISRTMMNGYRGSMSLFDNELYQQLFNQILLKTQAVEYYMVDNSGSFLFLDKEANPTWLIIRHATELKEQLDFLQGYDVPDQIISSVAKKEKMLFLLSEEEYRKPIDEWVRYIFESKKLDNNLYYSVIEGRLTDSVKWDKVVSYASLLTAR